MSFEVIIILILILANGIFAMSEIAIVSSKKIRLQKLAEKGNKNAKIALDLAAEPNKFLATVQFGITLISILTGVYGGNSIAAKLMPYVEQFEALKPYAQAISFGVVVLIITYLSLVVGELVPKRIGFSMPEKIAVVVSPLMLLLSKIGSPFVWLLSKTSDMLLSLLGLNKVREDMVTEEEIKAMIEEGTQGGQFEKTEQKMVEQVFKMADKRVSELMIPRIDVVWLDVNDTNKENLAIIKEHDYSNYPVCEDSLDTILGMVSVRDLLIYQMEHNKAPDNLRLLMKEPLYVPESMSAFRMLDEMQDEGMDIALVIDEFGTVQGIIDMNDVLQNIADPTTPHEETNYEEDGIVKREDGSYLLDGMLSKDIFKELLKIEELPDEDYYSTLAGFIMNEKKQIPSEGEHLLWNGYDFEIIDMDGNRIDKIVMRIV